MLMEHASDTRSPRSPSRHVRAWSMDPAAAGWATKVLSSMRSRTRVADSVSIFGRRTNSAGERSIIPSKTQIR